MSPALLRRFSPLLACCAFAVGGGLLGGATAVHGLRLNSYGGEAAPKIEISTAAPTSDRYDCPECSDRSLGFHWAGSRGISSAVDCPADSWEFRQGCAAYVNGLGS